MSYFGPRQAQTTLPCPSCGAPLTIERSCREVRMRCPGCGKSFPLKDFIGNADEAMEQFLENVYCDRI
ncbi:MAG: hypothetical protein HDQ89_02815 [Desulfovibrio sp.]|nr:hypothetical protein [Desulfovibrio sp.]